MDLLAPSRPLVNANNPRFNKSISSTNDNLEFTCNEANSKTQPKIHDKGPQNIADNNSSWSSGIHQQPIDL